MSFDFRLSIDDFTAESLRDDGFRFALAGQTSYGQELWAGLCIEMD
jgi:hypothetical protein